ncbi:MULTISPECIES: sensor histidine kinase [Olivibacter]|uniref:Sensor histidine kinase n=1 Tax=Olivibacter jilunii TaxID=985016 RepID=A0ABW6B7U7_9SPHI|nr:histidine kinase [Pseudosphingobacterium sp.]
MARSSKSTVIYIIAIALITLAVFVGVQVFSDELDVLYAVVLLWILFVIILLWFGNRYLYRLLDQSVPWLKHPSARFFLQLICSSIFSLAVINLTYYLFKRWVNEDPPDHAQMLVLNIYGLLFIIPILSINFGIYFMMLWKKAEVKSNLLNERHLRSQLDALRLQVDPHFLFNSLNVLAGLIEKDGKSAQYFLEKFAEVYRYILQYRKEDLVPLHIELSFVQAYVHLLKQRFGKALRVTLEVTIDESNPLAIPPMALQMLIENAVKHNVIAKETPLVVDVRLTKWNSLTVINNYQPLSLANHNKPGTGMDNIRKRYMHLSDELPVVQIDGPHYKVELPLFEMEE